MTLDGVQRALDATAGRQPPSVMVVNTLTRADLQKAFDTLARGRPPRTTMLEKMEVPMDAWDLSADADHFNALALDAFTRIAHPSRVVVSPEDNITSPGELCFSAYLGEPGENPRGDWVLRVGLQCMPQYRDPVWAASLWWMPDVTTGQSPTLAASVSEMIGSRGPAHFKDEMRRTLLMLGRKAHTLATAFGGVSPIANPEEKRR